MADVKNSTGISRQDLHLKWPTSATQKTVAIANRYYEKHSIHLVNFAAVYNSTCKCTFAFHETHVAWLNAYEKINANTGNYHGGDFNEKNKCAVLRLERALDNCKRLKKVYCEDRNKYITLSEISLRFKRVLSNLTDAQCSLNDGCFMCEQIIQYTNLVEDMGNCKETAMMGYFAILLPTLIAQCKYIDNLNNVDHIVKRIKNEHRRNLDYSWPPILIKWVLGMYRYEEDGHLVLLPDLAKDLLNNGIPKEIQSYINSEVAQCLSVSERREVVLKTSRKLYDQLVAAL